MSTNSARSRRVALRVVEGALSLSFLVGAVTHAGVRLPLGFATIDEPTIVPASIVEGVIAIGFAVTLLAELTGRPYARIALQIALRLGIAGVLLGMFALALGRGTRTELNDVFHVVWLVVMLLTLRLTAWGRNGRGCWAPRSRLSRRAT
jgi:hypothetical protein